MYIEKNEILPWSHTYFAKTRYKSKCISILAISFEFDDVAPVNQYM